MAKWGDFIEGKTGEGAASVHNETATKKEAIESAAKTETDTEDGRSVETEDATEDEGSPTRASPVVVVPPRSPRTRRAAAFKCEQKLRKVLNEEEEEDEGVQQRSKRQKLDHHALLACSLSAPLR